MTNHEKYRNASSIIKPSAEFATKVLKEAAVSPQAFYCLN